MNKARFHSPSNLQASQILSIEMLSELLRSSDSADLSKTLVEQLRELTGAKTVMLIGCNEKGKENMVLHACPLRRADIFAKSELDQIFSANLSLNRPQKKSELVKEHEVFKTLERNFIESIFRVFLKLGNELVGMLLLLDIPQVDRFEDILAIISILVTPISLLLKNVEAQDDIASKNQQIQQYVGKLESLVDQKTAELARANRILESEKELLAVTLRSLGEGVISTNPSGLILSMNLKAEELTGWSLTDAVGKEIGDVYRRLTIPDRIPVENPQNLLRVAKTGKYAEKDFILTSTRCEYVISETISETLDRHGNCLGVVIVFKDVTEKHRLLDTIQKTDRLESLGIMAGGIAHDFNNLLSGILGFIDMAVDETEPDVVKGLLKESLSSMERARALTNQLLTFAKGGEPKKESMNLFPFVEETIRFALSGSNHSYCLEVQEDLWNCRFDKNQIGQVIDNLIINAKQAMSQVGKIWVKAENCQLGRDEHYLLPEGKYVHLSIKDSGPGIPPEILKRIFDPFFTTKSSGSGLGLATCYSILRKHGGSIDAESLPDSGAVFHIFLPSSIGEVKITPETAKISHKGAGRVLVLDDEDLLLNLVELMLRRIGYSIVRAHDGIEAASIFTAEKMAGRNFVAAIFDLTIPGAPGGLDTISEIRKIDKDIPVFVMSGYHDSPVMANPTEFGFTCSLAKPFKLSEIVELFKLHLEN